MSRFGLIGPSYTSQSPNVDAQKTQNWLVEYDETGDGKSQRYLIPTAGLKGFSTVDKPIRGQVYVPSAGRYFVVGGASFYEIDQFGNAIKKNPLVAGAQVPLTNDGLTVSMAFSLGANQQLLLASKGQGYYFNLNGGTNLVNLGATLQNVAQVHFSDGYFIAQITNPANQFQMSALLDASTWPGTQVNLVSVFSDNIQASIVDKRQLWLFGSTATAVYYNSGSQNIFDVIPGGFFEAGIAAPLSRSKLDNTTFWIGADERGQGIAWRAVGYQPARISDFGVEYAWSQYSKISDAVGFAYQRAGHVFWQIYFPTPSKTWVYDATTGHWFERSSTVSGIAKAHLSQNHQFAFGKHLLGDWNSGIIYQEDPTFLDDNGTPIQRVRRAPPISMENEWVFHTELQVDMETGLGPNILQSDGSYRGPYLNLRWSDDGGHTWTNYYPRDCGQVGEFRKRVKWRRLGRSRARVYEISTAEAFPARIIDGDLQANTLDGTVYAPSERQAHQARKVA